MYCKDIMIDRHSTVTVPPGYLLSKALARMELYGHRALPVVEFAKLYGVVDKYSILERIYIKEDIARETATVADVMRTDIQTLTTEDYIEKAASLFTSQRYQFIPVIMPGTPDQYMGIIPVSAVMYLFKAAMGMGKCAHRITIDIAGDSDALLRLTRAIAKADAHIISLVTLDNKEIIHEDEKENRATIVIKFTGEMERVRHQIISQGAVITHHDRVDGAELSSPGFLTWVFGERA